MIVCIRLSPWLVFPISRLWSLQRVVQADIASRQHHARADDLPAVRALSSNRSLRSPSTKSLSSGGTRHLISRTARAGGLIIEPYREEVRSPPSSVSIAHRTDVARERRRAESRSAFCACRRAAVWVRLSATVPDPWFRAGREWYTRH